MLQKHRICICNLLVIRASSVLIFICVVLKETRRLWNSVFLCCKNPVRSENESSCLEKSSVVCLIPLLLSSNPRWHRAVCFSYFGKKRRGFPFEIAAWPLGRCCHCFNRLAGYMLEVVPKDKNWLTGIGFLPIVWSKCKMWHPILERGITVLLSLLLLLLCHAQVTPLDSETGWTGDFWPKTN